MVYRNIALYMQTQGSDVTTILVFGTVANAIFLGSMGMLISALTGNTVIGYMPLFLYYVLNIGMGLKLGNFYLFSMTVGNFRAKIWLLAAGVLMIMVSLFSTRILQKHT